MACVKWLSPRGTYAITRCDETLTHVWSDDLHDPRPERRYFTFNTTLVAYAAAVPVLTLVTLGTHARARANARTKMAKLVCDLGGSWTAPPAARL